MSVGLQTNAKINTQIGFCTDTNLAQLIHGWATVCRHPGYHVFESISLNSEPPPNCLFSSRLSRSSMLSKLIVIKQLLKGRKRPTFLCYAEFF